MPRMSWRSVGICILTVTLAACATKSSPQPSGTVGTAAPATTAAPTTTVSTTAVEPSTTTPAPTTSDLGPGPSDAEIQKILDDTDAKTAVIFAAFKKDLVITPAIDQQIVEAFGPAADDVREAIRAFQLAGGVEIRNNPGTPKTIVRKVLSRSSLCAVVQVDLDPSAMLVRDPTAATFFLRQVEGHWYSIGEFTTEQAAVFGSRPCYVQ